MPETNGGRQRRNIEGWLKTGTISGARRRVCRIPGNRIGQTGNNGRKNTVRPLRNKGFRMKPPTGEQ